MLNLQILILMIKLIHAKTSHSRNEARNDKSIFQKCFSPTYKKQIINIVIFVLSKD